MALHFRRVLAERAMLSAPGLEESGNGKHGCRNGAPDRRLHCCVIQTMALGQLNGANNGERPRQYNNEASDPKCGAHGDVPRVVEPNKSQPLPNHCATNQFGLNYEAASDRPCGAQPTW
jgi:hypothetical protein